MALGPCLSLSLLPSDPPSPTVSQPHWTPFSPKSNPPRPRILGPSPGWGWGWGWEVGAGSASSIPARSCMASALQVGLAPGTKISCLEVGWSPPRTGLQVSQPPLAHPLPPRTRGQTPTWEQGSPAAEMSAWQTGPDRRLASSLSGQCSFLLPGPPDEGPAGLPRSREGPGLQTVQLLEGRIPS